MLAPPALPATSVYVVATVQVLVSSSVPSVGVNVPVHVVPTLDMAASVPEVHVTSSSLAKPATVSEKMIVRVAVSPSLKAVSPMAMLLTEGARVSTA